MEESYQILKSKSKLVAIVYGDKQNATCTSPEAICINRLPYMYKLVKVDQC